MTKIARYFSATALVLVATTPAMATDYLMQIIPAQDQAGQVVSGVEIVESYGAESVIRFLEPEGTFDKRGAIALVFINLGEHPFNAGPENVTARLADGTPVEIISYEKLAKEEARRQGRREFFAALGALGNSMEADEAGYTSGTFSYSGQASGFVGGVPYQAQTGGTGTYTAYDPAAAALAKDNAARQNAQLAERVQQKQAVGLADLSRKLRTTTVTPGALTGGQVVFELPRKARSSKEPIELLFQIRAGQDVHSVKVMLSKLD